MVKTDQTQTEWFAVLLDLILSVTLRKMIDSIQYVNEFFTRSSERKIKGGEQWFASTRIFLV